MRGHDVRNVYIYICFPGKFGGPWLPLAPCMFRHIHEDQLMYKQKASRCKSIMIKAQPFCVEERIFHVPFSHIVDFF